MTLDEKISLVHGVSRAAGTGGGAGGAATRSNGGAGFAEGIPRLGLPDLQMADAAVGVALAARRGRYATPLPSTAALAATWDLELGYMFGALIGRELRDQGYNVSLGGGVNLMREPRNGRNFEYHGEDPILAGRMVAQIIRGEQDQHVVGDIKHYALNDQETGREVASVVFDKRAMRETDLLAFEIGVRDGKPGMVMCAYNRVDGVYACEHDYLLSTLLKKTWGFAGWVVSDWGATHSTVRAALAGLDQEMPDDAHFGAALKRAVETGEVPMARLDDMVHRIVRTEFASGIVDNPPVMQVPDVGRGFEVAERVAEDGCVLLKNVGGLLPLAAGAVRSIAVIGSHADVGVLSGSGSAQVDPPGGNAVPVGRAPGWDDEVWHRSPPLRAIRAKAKGAEVVFDPGTDLSAAAVVAKRAEVVIVFVSQPMSEGRDAASLALPGRQDALVEAVAAVNRQAVVVLETGGAVAMPWIDRVGAVLEAWYPGIRGGEAIASLLFGDAIPAGKLPMTFAVGDADLPRPGVPGLGSAAGPPAAFDIHCREGLKVGYKWFDAERKTPLFAFGYGLSYTTFAYAGLTVHGRDVSFVVKNTGGRAGAEVAQVYISLPAVAGEPPRRLVAWKKVRLAPGESARIALTLDPLTLSVFDVAKDTWVLVPGDYTVFVGSSSRNLALSANARY